MRSIRLLLLLFSLIAPLIYAANSLDGIRARYSADHSECPPAASAASAASASTELPVVTATIQKQSDVLLNWAFTLAGGVVAFLVTPALHQFRYIHFIHLLLGPALSFLAGSIAASLLLLRRMTFLHLNGCLVPTDSINDLLGEQTFYLSCAAVLLFLFAGWCLIELALQWTHPHSPSP